MTDMDAVLFDMDGLMIDSERVWSACWQRGAAQVGVEFPEELYLELIGLNWPATKAYLVERLGPEYPLEQLIEASSAAYATVVAEHPNLAKPGLYELLDYLEERGLKKGVATSTQRDGTEKKLKLIGVRERMEQVVCGDEVENGKPHPEPYLSLAERLEVPPRRCLALEDSHNGVRSAHAAGMKVIMVPDLKGPNDEMRAKCFAIMDSLHAVRAFLQEKASA